MSTDDYDRTKAKLDVANALSWEAEMLREHGAGSAEHEEARRVLREAVEKLDRIAAADIDPMPVRRRSNLDAFTDLVRLGVDPYAAARHVRGEGGVA